MIPKLPQGQPRGHTNSAKSKPIYLYTPSLWWVTVIYIQRGASDTHSPHEVLMSRVFQIYNLIIWPPPGTGPGNVFCVLAPFYNVKQ